MEELKIFFNDIWSNYGAMILSTLAIITPIMLGMLKTYVKNKADEKLASIQAGADSKLAEIDDVKKALELKYEEFTKSQALERDKDALIALKLKLDVLVGDKLAMAEDRVKELEERIITNA